MRGRHLRRVLEFNGRRYEESILTCLTEGPTSHWSIDVPTVLWMLERISAGDIDPSTARDEIRLATSWESGCCGECDRAVTHYDEALNRHERAVQRWVSEQEQLDAAHYPYILNKGKIHTLTCQHPPKPSPPWFPENLHMFAVFFDSCGEDLDAVFAELDRRSSRGVQRISVSYVQNELARGGLGSVKPKLCRTCRPPLPDLDPSTTVLQPACWGWPADLITLDRLRAEALLSPLSDKNTLPEQRASFAMLERWHDGRCAICGKAPTPRGLVRDHDHETGSIRGLLCHSCNTTEGRSTSELFANYRLRPPSAILAVEVLYLPFGFHVGTGHLLRDAGGGAP